MIYAVVLSAGSSTRMDGKPKALLRDSRNQTYLQRIAGTAREGGCGGVIAVVGAPHADLIKKALPPGVASTINPMPNRGMISSVQSGINALPTNCSGILIWPVDIAFVKASTVRTVINATAGRIVVPRSGGKGGHPLRIPRQFFGDVMGLDDEGGLKKLLDLRANVVERIDVDDPGVLVDVDTPDDAKSAEDRASGVTAKKK